MIPRPQRRFPVLPRFGKNTRFLPILGKTARGPFSRFAKVWQKSAVFADPWQIFPRAVFRAAAALLPVFLPLAAPAGDAPAHPWRAQILPPENAALTARAYTSANPAERLRLYADALRACRTNAAAMHAIARHCLDSGQPAKAASLFSLLLQSWPGEPDFLVPLSEAHLALPRPSRAALEADLRGLQAAAPRFPRDPDIPCQVSRLALVLGDYPLALDSARTAVRTALDLSLPAVDIAIYRLQDDIAQQAFDTFLPVE